MNASVVVATTPLPQPINFMCLATAADGEGERARRGESGVQIKPLRTLLLPGRADAAKLLLSWQKRLKRSGLCSPIPSPIIPPPPPPPPPSPPPPRFHPFQRISYVRVWRAVSLIWTGWRLHVCYEGRGGDGGRGRDRAIQDCTVELLISLESPTIHPSPTHPSAACLQLTTYLWFGLFNPSGTAAPAVHSSV